MYVINSNINKLYKLSKKKNSKKKKEYGGASEARGLVERGFIFEVRMKNLLKLVGYSTNFTRHT